MTNDLTFVASAIKDELDRWQGCSREDPNLERLSRTAMTTIELVVVRIIWRLKRDGRVAEAEQFEKAAKGK